MFLYSKLCTKLPPWTDQQCIRRLVDNISIQNSRLSNKVHSSSGIIDWIRKQSTFVPATIWEALGQGPRSRRLEASRWWAPIPQIGRLNSRAAHMEIRYDLKEINLLNQNDSRKTSRPSWTLTWSMAGNQLTHEAATFVLSWVAPKSKLYQHLEPWW